MQRLHERIKQIRGDMSREEFAQLVGISPRALITYELNERTPKADLLNRICAGTNVLPEWLLMGTGPVRAGGIVPPSEPSDTENVRRSDALKTQHPKIVNSTQKNISDCRTISESASLQQELNILNRELRDAIRQNGDLRVEVERLRARVRDLERELREALKPEGGTPPMASAG